MTQLFLFCRAMAMVTLWARIVDRSEIYETFRGSLGLDEQRQVPATNEFYIARLRCFHHSVETDSPLLHGVQVTSRLGLWHLWTTLGRPQVWPMGLIFAD